MKQFYSSLIINSKSFPGVHQVFKPRFNKEFFRRITANIEQLEASISERFRNPDPRLGTEHLKKFRENSKELVSLKERLEKATQDETKFQEILSRLEEIEDLVMPTVTKLPNRCSKLVPREDVVVDEIQSNFMAEQRLAKVLSHRKLSYINNCYVKSVVGPNSHYYFGIGAKLQHAIANYFLSTFEHEKFILMSGMCLTKSAVVEAANSSDNKEYLRDPARILTEEHKYVTSHLSESSREALVGFMTTLGSTAGNDPVRFMTRGAGYRLGSDWFDGDNRHITQSETLNTLTLNSSIEQYSMKEYLATRDILWSGYKALEIPSRLVHCSLKNMHGNEYDSHRVELWLPSQDEWLQVARVSHYLDHITVRVGMKRGHLIDSSVFDGQVLAAAIIENRQTALGKFIIPDALRDHSPHLNTEELSSYFAAPQATSPTARVLHNHEQRRFLTKQNYPFGHSRKAHEVARRNSFYRLERMAIGILIMLAIIIDWREFWYDYMPDWSRSFLYDYIYRPPRRIWWSLVCEEGKFPADTPYAELDRYEFDRTMWERRKEVADKRRGRLDTRKVNEKPDGE